MLTELRISNFGVIEQLAVRFGSGFIVFTGETGAGKSLLIDAVTLLVGGRASVEHIRAQADEADLEAVFVLPPDHSLLHMLQSKEFARAGETEILIRRVISRAGRNRTYLNANLCPVHVLEELGGALVDVHGQHDQQSLLVTGESGTGKELVAKAIHYNSARRERPFVALNCAALPETLIESELFGHEKGSFTDATARRVGQFELAHSGTLFLDEIGDLSPATQAKLLRVLQEREFTRVGGVQSIKVDVRIVAATNKNLDELVRKGLFREDLYYRINVIALYLPPLRERGEDIALLAKHFLAKRIEEEKRPAQEFSKDSLELIAHYPWPGNVREMENIIEQAFIWSKGSNVILPEHLPTILRADTRSTSLRDDTLAGRMSLEKAVMEFEREIILDALKRTTYVQTHAATMLGISRRMLKYRMDTLGISRPDSGPAADSSVTQE